MPKIYPFQYSDGDQFTFTRVDSFNRLQFVDYNGYYTKDQNGNYFGTRQITDTSQSLSANDTIANDYIEKNFYFNRTVDEPIILPYGRDSIFFEANERVNKNTINDRFRKLHENFLSLYSFAFIPDNNFTVNYTGFIGLTSNPYTLKVTTSSLSYSIDTDLPSFNLGVNAGGSVYPDSGSGDGHTPDSGIGGQLSAANAFEVIGMQSNTSQELLKETPKDVFLTYATPSALYMFGFDNDAETSSANFILSTNKVGGLFSQRYQNITDITSNGFDSLYVVDSYHNQIYRLYIDPILNVSRIDASNYDLIGTGGIKLNTAGTQYLSGSNNIYYYDNEVYVYNDGRGDITVANENLKFQRSYNNPLLSAGEVADFAINPIDNNIYMLLNDFSLFVIPREFNADPFRLYPKNDGRTGEVPVRLLFSKNVSNTYYIATRKNVYKFYLNKGQFGNLGDYDWTILDKGGTSDTTGTITFTGDDTFITDMKILSEDETYDSIFIYSKQYMRTNADVITGANDRILRFTDSNNLKTVLNDTSFKAFTYDDIKLQDEFFNNITYNKAIKKLVYNLDNYAENLTGNFRYKFDTGQFARYTDTITLSSPFIKPVTYDYFAGVNEVITPQTFNRTLDNILRYQEAILAQITSDASNNKFADNIIISI